MSPRTVKGSSTAELALVMSGGGARAAYQVGFLQGLARHYPDLHIPILTGVSAGAINAAFLASRIEGFRDKVEALARIWATLTPEQIFLVDSLSVAANVLRWGARLLMGRASRAIKVRSLLDTRPLRSMLEHLFKPTNGVIPGIADNLAQGTLKALAITTTNYSTGQSITWVQGQEITHWNQPYRKSMSCHLTLEHILASASLPMFFPAVRIGDCWYGDGGIRMMAPLSPAIHLGANRILAISTRHWPSGEEADCPNIDDYPPPAQVASVVLDTIFFDALELDALRVEVINRLIAKLPEDPDHSMRFVELLLLRPSQDLGKLASAYEPSLPRAFRYMTRGLGTEETRSNDLLSLLMFEPDYLNQLIQLGQQDMEARKNEIDAFLRRSSLLEDGSSPFPSPRTNPFPPGLSRLRWNDSERKP